MNFIVFLWMILFYTLNILSGSETAFFFCGDIILYDNEVRFLSSQDIPAVQCLWRLSAPKEYILVIASLPTPFDLSYDCEQASVVLFEGDLDSLESVGQFCWNRPVQYISTTNTMLILFNSVNTVKTKKYTLSLSRVRLDSEDPCNNTVTEAGYLFSIEYPENYLPDTLCLYRIKAPDKKRIKLTFVDFMLENSNCTFDFLTVHDGNSSDSIQIGKYCGQIKPEPVVSSSSDLFLQFRSDYELQDKGFKLHIEFIGEKPYDDCNRVITMLGETLSSPMSNNSKYQQGKHCVTKLIAPVSHRVALHFDVIDIEKSPECFLDHVTVTDPNIKGSNSFRLCGDHEPGPNYVSKERELELEFQSDYKVEARGYLATYNFIHENKIDADFDNKNIISKRQCCAGGTCYNDGDGNKCLCQTGFVPPECTQRLGFLERTANSSVKLSHTISLKCRVNHPHRIIVWFFNETKVSNKLLPHNINNNGDLVIPIVQTVHEGTYKCEVLASGTLMSHSIWLNVEKKALTCGWNVTLSTNDAQFLSSPNSVSGSYINNADCLWRISAPRGNRIIIASDSFLLEPSCDCLYDFVELLQGNISHVVSAGRFCWDNPIYFISISETVFIRFHSDDSVNATGFLLSLKRTEENAAAQCNNTITSQGLISRIKYPEHFPTNTLCLYLIHAPEGNRINLTFIDFQQEHLLCSDYLTVYDGPSSGSTEIGSFGCRNNPVSIISSSSDVLLVHKFDHDLEHKGFKTQIQFFTETTEKMYSVFYKPAQESYDPECTETISMLGRNLTSPNYGTSTPTQNKHCQTTILAPANHLVKLNFEKIDIEKSSECLFDHLTIKDGTNSIRLCGYHGKGLSLESRDRKVELEYQTDSSFQSEGYFATYSFVSATTEDDGHENDFSCGEQFCVSNATCYNDGDGNKCACLNGLVPPNCTEMFDFTEKSANLTAELFKSIKIKCRVNHPYRIIVWYFGDSVITSSKTHTVDSNGDLTIRHVQSSDQGSYRCEVLASRMVVSHSVWLRVKERRENICGISNVLLHSRYKRNLRRKRIISHRILGFHSKHIVNIPWQAFLWTTRYNITFCGGAIISERWILTVAHCITKYGNREKNVAFNTNEVFVYAGTGNCVARSEETPLMKIKSFRIHPRYGKMNIYNNDIALIKLQDSFQFSDAIRPICMPTPQEAKWLAKPGTYGVVSGCGYTKQKRPAEWLKYVEVPIKDKETCLNSVSEKLRTPESSFCAGYEKAGEGDACQGDSGGPLVVQYDNRWYLIGLVSHGDDCDRSSKYGFYTNVSHYYYWIKPYTDGCGLKSESADENDSPQFRIYGGEIADVGFLPWVAGIAVMKRKNKTNVYHCAGVILGEYWILTAAHCVHGRGTLLRKVFVYVGSTGVADTKSFRITGANIFLLPDYHPGKYAFYIHDLALLHLNRPRIKNSKLSRFRKGIEFSQFVQPICLPSGTAEQTGTECYISGWGETERTKHPDTLRWAKVNIVEKCEWNINAKANVLCAGKKNADTCTGDSGGGLICKAKDKCEVTGVASFGSGTCQNSSLTAFTRVSSYITWIRETIRTESYSFEDWDF